MPNTLKRTTGVATVAGTVIHTVPANTTLTIIGLRGSNNDPNADHTFHVKCANRLISGINTPVPIGSAIDIMVGSKIVAQAGDQIVAYCDVDNKIDVYMSFLEQS